MHNLKNKKVGIFGLGITGKSIHSSINSYAQEIICWDDSKQTRKTFVNQELLYDLSNDRWKYIDLVFISPGVPPNHQVFLLSKERRIVISSDIELFIHNNPYSKIIAITGTNGKSTTTALIGHILNKSGYNFAIGGNIGRPVLSLPKNMKGYILELSSFQLDLISYFKPTVSVLLNISPDHLDRYNTLNEYSKSKMKIFSGNGIKIIGVDTEISKNIYNTLIHTKRGNIVAISKHKERNTISCSDNLIYDNFYDNNVYYINKFFDMVSVSSKENVAASYAVCRSLNLKSTKIVNQLSSFQGLKHRMQNIGSKNNVTYYNNSKATNIAAAILSLTSIANIFWLAGGLFKEDTLHSIDKALSNVKKAYIFGASSLLFFEYLRNKIKVEIFSTMKDAFYQANTDAKNFRKESSVILSPACASFDQFNNFEDRGNKFIDLCNEELIQE